MNSPIPAAVLDQFSDTQELNPTPWTYEPTKVMGYFNVRDANGNFLGTLVGASVAARAVAAVNNQE